MLTDSDLQSGSIWLFTVLAVLCHRWLPYTSRLRWKDDWINRNYCL